MCKKKTKTFVFYIPPWSTLPPLMLAHILTHFLNFILCLHLNLPFCKSLGFGLIYAMLTYHFVLCCPLFFSLVCNCLPFFRFACLYRFNNPS